jgi:predicted Zn finger-like uncharacterized protein
MRISCPNCDAAYEVPDTALAAGPRRLRCARCGHQFQAALPGAAAARAEPRPVPARAAGPAARPEPPAALAPSQVTPLPATSGPVAGTPPRLAEKVAADMPPASPAAEPRPVPAAARGKPAAARNAPTAARPGLALPPIPDTRSQPKLRDSPTSPPDRFALAGWVLTIVVLAAAGYAAYAFRAEIIAAWPPALRVYALLGLG